MVWTSTGACGPGRVHAMVDFTFAGDAIARTCGANGNVPVDLVVRASSRVCDFPVGAGSTRGRRRVLFRPPSRVPAPCNLPPAGRRRAQSPPPPAPPGEDLRAPDVESGKRPRCIHRWLRAGRSGRTNRNRARSWARGEFTTTGGCARRRRPTIRRIVRCVRHRRPCRGAGERHGPARLAGADAAGDTHADRLWRRSQRERPSPFAAAAIAREEARALCRRRGTSCGRHTGNRGSSASRWRGAGFRMGCVAKLKSAAGSVIDGAETRGATRRGGRRGGRRAWRGGRGSGRRAMPWPRGAAGR